MAFTDLTVCIVSPLAGTEGDGSDDVSIQDKTAEQGTILSSFLYSAF
jgi:hypothetical protein